MDIDGFQSIVEALAQEIPEEILWDLNGGILILPESKFHPKDQADNLYIMGEYCVRIPGMGRYVVLYYGSFEQVYGQTMPNDSPQLAGEIRKTLLHELRHHLESLSGIRDLELDDERMIGKYLRTTKPRGL